MKERRGEEDSGREEGRGEVGEWREIVVERRGD